MKNLIMIHLESLNYQLFMNFPEIFKEINKVKLDGLYFNHYFSTATSTLMVVGDIVYGGKEQYEICSSLDDIPVEYYYKSSLFDDLKKKGYQTGIFVYPNGGDRESAEERHIAGFENEMLLKPDYEELLASVDHMITDQPFAVWVCNYISNISLNCYTENSYFADGTAKWKHGYECLDQCVGDIVSLLRKKNQLENTELILYGDHGDDFWGHGMHGGLTHAIEPYAALIHTPMIILDRETPGGLDESLICATDLKQIILEKLKFSEKTGIKNDYVIARSSYAAQPVRKDTFNKAYSITDGKFLMMVSNYGLELYDIEMDFQCSCNFLELFMLDGTIIRYDAEKSDKYKFHYQDFMNHWEITRLRQTAYYLRKKLYDETLKLYNIAGKSESDMVEELSFNTIRHCNR